jgi:ElaA protein
VNDAGTATETDDAAHPIVVHTAAFDDLDASTLYDILRLRAEVFVVEQRCAFCDLDDRDREPGAMHLWLERDARIIGYARLLFRDDRSEIGRIVTPLSLRRTGTGVRLMREAMARIEGPIYLKAQARLAAWYERFGFTVAGPEFDEDGIPHVPMHYEP